MGTNGSVLVDRDGLRGIDLGGHKTDEFRAKKEATSSADLVGRDCDDQRPPRQLYRRHHEGRETAFPRSRQVAVTMLQLSNIAWEVQRELKLDTSNGKIVGDAEAMQGWAANMRRDGSAPVTVFRGCSKFQPVAWWFL